MNSSKELKDREAEDIRETSSKPLETLIKQSLQTQHVYEKLHNQLGPLGQKYVSILLDRETKINHVYGVYLRENGTMLGDKQFDLEGFRDCRWNKVQRFNHKANSIVGSKGYKYKNIIASLVSAEDIRETSSKPLETLIKQSLQTQHVYEKLHNQLGPLGQKYVSILLDRETKINHVYGVYLRENGTMLGDKQFDLEGFRDCRWNKVQRLNNQLIQDFYEIEYWPIVNPILEDSSVEVTMP
ncbi:hypothetical protein G5I_10894 [Acromyrmex echinatior]|uniref:Uncharacterized protein n=1 Tax=Acromyrmex echinatior TaxID=103372 RepID=F4WY47_ACREC|nr:hypothetical protein G5I_10894 [Acromyrmex echinatior]